MIFSMRSILDNESLSQPLVSIIMAAYNADRFIGGAIRSVLSQTYTNIELIIVDDGSTDRTRSVIEQFADDRIRYYYQVNRGVSAARNVALDEMRGDFFCFLDADDELTSTSIEKRLRLFLTNEDVYFVDGTVEILDADMRRRLEVRRHDFMGRPFTALLRLDNSCFFGPTWMIKVVHGRKDRFLEGLTHSEDLLFYLSISADGGDYQAVDDIIYRYRKGHASAMSNLDQLWQGYKSVSRTIQSWPVAREEDVSGFRRKIRLIMFKSFLSRLRVFSAMKALVEPLT